VSGWPGSLRGRLLLPVILLAALAWLVAAALTWRDVSHELDELLDGHLAQAAALLVVQQAGKVVDDGPLHLPVLHRQAGKVAFQVFRAERLTLHSANAPDEPMATAADAERGPRTVSLKDGDWRIFVARGAEPGTWACVGERLDSRADILQAVLRSALAPMAGVLPLLALALAWAIHEGLLPLRQLGRQLAARRPQALEPVTVAGAPTEMLPMIAALNGLFSRIEAMMDAERRFTADASHELRTPIAAIRAQAQAALGARDDAERRQALQSTLAGCDRAGRVIEQLLTLARLEAGNAPTAQRFDLVEAARGVLADAAPAAHAQGQALSLDAPPSGPVQGDPTLISVLVRNLIDNALRYSPAGAQVQVTITTTPDGVSLQVEDSGPGLSDGERARLGERFFRVLGSGQSGSGLGWSIVRRIAEAHGAPLTVARSARLGGLAVTLQMPASP
jgi:two-component system, OmpR family, sensor histidine kinase QseC